MRALNKEWTHMGLLFIFVIEFRYYTNDVNIQ